MGFLGILFRFREKKSPDKLGLYPEAVHIDAMPERRYLWTSRILVIVGAISMSVTIMLACTVYLLLPQRGARPRLLQTNKFFSQLENSDPAEKKMPVMDLVTEQLIEKYSKLRHEIPESQSQLYNRWAMKSEFYWLSSVGVFQEFASKATSEQIIKFIKQGITRKVEMEWTRRVTGNLWQSQFHTIIRYPDIPDPVVIVWRAYMRIDYNDIDLEKRDGLVENPFGFKITKYSLSYVGTPEKPVSYLETAKKIRENHLVE